MDRFLEHIRPYVPGCSDDWISRAVLNSAIRFCARTKIWQQETEHSMVAEDEAITLTLPDDSVVFSVLVSDTFSGRVDYTLASGVITFTDAFTAAATITVVSFLKPDREAFDLPDILYDDCFDGIESGASAEILMMPGKPWTDFSLSAIKQKQYLHNIGEAKIKAIKNNSQEILVVKKRRFV